MQSSTWFLKNNNHYKEFDKGPKYHNEQDQKGMQIDGYEIQKVIDVA